MIEVIKGLVTNKDENSLIIMLGGVGLKVWTTTHIIDKTDIGENINLITDLVLRETDVSLYGFEGERERNMFRNLMKVNGVGPKAALAILSTLSINEIYHAVQTKKYTIFTPVPRIGKKTAQKLILNLSDKLDMDEGLTIDPGVATVNSDLLEALVGLGYSVVEAQAAIQTIPEQTAEDLEIRLRIALQYFS